MKNELVATLSKHNIYYVKSGQIPFYIAVPYKEYNKTNICLEFYHEYSKLDTSKNDVVWIRDEIIRIYSEIDNDNITLVIPIWKDNKIEQTDNLIEQNLFQSIDQEISNIINNAYQTLKENNISVESRIFVINNGRYNNFLKWFLGKYNTRVEYYTFIDLKNNTSQGDPSFNNIQPIPIQTPITQNSNNNIGIVVGNTYPTPQSIPELSPQTGSSSTTNTSTREQIEVPNVNESSGYVSYILLGVLTAIISLVILYIIL